MGYNLAFKGLSIVLDLTLAFSQPAKNLPCPLSKSTDACRINNDPQFDSVVSKYNKASTQPHNPNSRPIFNIIMSPMHKGFNW
jgi:hypothetical protein